MRFLLGFVVLIAASCATAQDAATWSPGDSPAFHRPLESITGLKVPTGFPGGVKTESLTDVVVALPVHFDWRDVAPGLSPVRDQGSCGSCWSFSINATMEDILTLTGVPTALSQQYLVSCNKLGYGCNGGFFDAADMMVSPGSVSAAQYPYTGTDSACKSGLKYGEKLTSWTYLPGAEGGEGIPTPDEIKKAIYLYGPVSVAVYASSAMQSYRSGVFNTCGNGGINHAVNLVGWDDAGQYWIMRNSWDSTWGENGFMRIKWGCNKIGFAANHYKFRLDPNPAEQATVPACELTAVPSRIKLGESSVLTIVGRNGAETAEIAGQAVAVAGGAVTVSPTTSTQYTATVKGPTGQGTCTAKVEVGSQCAPMPIADTGPDRETRRRQEVTLGTAAIEGSTYFWTSKLTGGTWDTAMITVKPNKRGVYVYTLVVTTACGTATKNVTVTVK